MNTENLADYYFSKEHQWVTRKTAEARIGISDYAQEQMGDFVFVELPSPGRRFKQGECFGTMEAVKAVADLYCPISCEVVAVNSELDLDPSLLNQDSYGRGWMIQVQPTNLEEYESLYNYVTYKAEILQEIVHILYLDEANQLHYIPAVRGEDGKIVVGTGAFSEVITSAIISATRLKRLEVVDEFEELINKPGLRELELQDFFERHPEFLLGSDYEKLFPQVVLKREGEDELRPDFILQPVAGVSYEANIVELKLPTQRIVKPTPRREGMYAKLYEAVMQLRMYARFFREEENREFIRKTLGFTAYQPRLTLIVGRTLEIADEAVRSEILNSIKPVELVTYEDLIAKYRRLVESL